MELQELTQFLKKKWQILTAIVLVFVIIGVIASLAQPRKYRSEQRFLFVQQFDQDVDPYAASRSTEYLTNLMAEVMYSQLFFDQVVKSSITIDQSAFPLEAKDRQKAWKKTLRTNSHGDTGILDVTVYSKDRYQAEQISLAIAQVLKNNHGQFHSRGNSVAVQTIDSAITSLRPVQPNIPLNLGAGAVLGLILGLAFIYLMPDVEWTFGTFKRTPKMNPPREPDWAKPLAVPMAEVKQTVQLQSMPRSMYEEADVKLPRGAARNLHPEHIVF